MLTSLSSMEKEWQVEPQGRWDGQGILQLPQRMTFILIADLGRRQSIFEQALEYGGS